VEVNIRIQTEAEAVDERDGTDSHACLAGLLRTQAMFTQAVLSAVPHSGRAL
jgi:hypothetical protein